MISRILINFQRSRYKKSTFTPLPLHPRQVMSFFRIMVAKLGYPLRIWNGWNSMHALLSRLGCQFWVQCKNFIHILYPITVYVKFSFFRKLVKRHITILHHTFFDNSRPILLARRNMNLLFLSSETTLSEKWSWSQSRTTRNRMINFEKNISFFCKI